MPRPPNFDGLQDLKFITNYVLAGCTPPAMLFVEFAQEPAWDLGLMIFTPDLEDIGQAIFDPKKKRRRSPGRHGKKTRRGLAIPDPSDLIGQRARGFLNPGNAFNFGPFRKAFGLLNKYEGISFAAAIADGLTDIGFEGLYGIFKVDPNHCQEFPRFARTQVGTEMVGGVGPTLWPIAMQQIDFVNGFQTTVHAATHQTQRFAVSVKMSFYNGGDRDDCRAQLGLKVIGGPVRAFSREAYIGPGETVHLECDGQFSPGEWCEWGVIGRGWNPISFGGAVLGYGISDWPWPWD